MARLR
ncbi:lipase family protein, partial [Vibrio cholerae HC-17A1]